MEQTEVFSIYQRLACVGTGGYAKAVKVRHRKWGYVRALKLFEAVNDTSDEKAYQNFMKECKVLMRSGNGNNTHVVQVYAPQRLGETAFYEMDYIEGCNLYQWVERNGGFVPADEVVRLARHISSALRYCHRDNYLHNMDREADNIPKDPEDGARLLVDEAKEQELIAKYRVVHNDIHPGNIMRADYDRRYILLDFGLAITPETAVTKSRLLNGVDDFLSPEKCQEMSGRWVPADITPASDIYCFGAVLYFVLTGQRGVRRQPLTADSLFQARQEAYRRRFPEQELSCPDYPDWLAEVLLRCVRLRPEDRFADGYELDCCIQAHVSEVPDAVRSARQSAEESLEQLREQLCQREEQLQLLQNQYRTLQLSHRLKEERLQRVNEGLKALLDEERKKTVR